MKKIISLVVLIGTTIFAQEVSVFGAGSVASDNPYGLTENEQVLLDNRKKVDNVENKLKEQQQEIIGLKSVVEGLTSQIAKIESRISDLEIRATGKVSQLANSSTSVVTKNEVDVLNKEISELKSQIEILNQKLAVQNTVKKNSTKESLNQKTSVNQLKNREKQEFKKEVTQKENSKNDNVKKSSNKVLAFDDMKLEDIENIAKNLFAEKKYTEAKIHYDYLSTKKYKVDVVNYMLGEIYYNQKSYANAIKSYQISLKNNDKASHIPELLYHSGLSLKNIGDEKNAEKFFTVLKTEYPNSSQAKSLQK